MKTLVVKTKAGEAKVIIMSDGKADIFSFDNDQVMDILRTGWDYKKTGLNIAEWTVKMTEEGNLDGRWDEESPDELWADQPENWKKEHMIKSTEITTENIQSSIEQLKYHFKSIKDFDLKLYNDDNSPKIVGGFYKMNCCGTPYYFHEIFLKVEDGDYSCVEQIENEIKKRIINMLAWQRDSDKSNAEEMGKKIRYTFDYSFLK